MGITVKAAFIVVCALIGAAFGPITTVAVVRLLSAGNVLEEAFLCVPGLPIGGLLGAFAGTMGGKQVLRRLAAGVASDTHRGSKLPLMMVLIIGIPTSFIAMGSLAEFAIEPPSDAVMLRQFDRHEGEFDQLVRMAAADKGLDRVDEDWTIPADARIVGVSSQRLADYRRFLRDAGIPRGFQTTQSHTGFNFFVWLKGSAISDDTEKGFAYRMDPPTQVVESLDGLSAGSTVPLIAYRHIRAKWYLFYEFLPD